MECFQRAQPLAVYRKYSTDKQPADKDAGEQQPKEATENAAAESTDDVLRQDIAKKEREVIDLKVNFPLLRLFVAMEAMN